MLPNNSFPSLKYADRTGRRLYCSVLRIYSPCKAMSKWYHCNKVCANVCMNVRKRTLLSCLITIICSSFVTQLICQVKSCYFWQLDWSQSQQSIQKFSSAWIILKWIHIPWIADLVTQHHIAPLATTFVDDCMAPSANNEFGDGSYYQVSTNGNIVM